MRKAVLLLLTAYLSTLLVLATLHNSHDFSVYWQAARHALAGDPIYSSARYGKMVFKYPPWILPIFFPFAYMPYEWAKFLWGIGEVSALFFIIWVLAKRYICSPASLLITTLAFWSLWIGHAIDGQITLLMLAIALAFGPAHPASYTALSTKLFTIVALEKITPKQLLTLSFCLLLASAPALWIHKTSLLIDFYNAAQSGSSLFLPHEITGKYNQSITGFLLNCAHIPLGTRHAEPIAFLISFLGIGLLYARRLKRCSTNDRFLGWLALAAVLHPLPWYHLFILSFPLACRTLTLAGKDKRAQLGAFLSTCAIAIASEKTLGPLGLFLQNNSCKSFGVLICLELFLWLSNRTSHDHPHCRQKD